MAKKKQKTGETGKETTNTVDESMSQPNELLPVPADEIRDLITIEDEIDPEVVEKIIAIGDAEVHYVRNSTGGFKVTDEDTRRELVGVITAIENYLIHFEEGVPERMADPGGKDLPPGFERRADCKIITRDGYRLGISIPGASLRKNFAGYLKKLANDGLRPNQVWTKFRCAERRAKDREGNSISFPFIECIALERVEPVPF